MVNAMTGKSKVPSTNGPDLLVNKLTVADARHLLRHEGADVSLAGLLTDTWFVLLTAGLVARAIWLCDATVWHLFLPLLAQYVALNTCLPVLQVFYRLPGFRSNVLKCLGNIAGWFAIAAILVVVRASWFEQDWASQFRMDWALARDWIVSHQMHWPVLAAWLAFAATLPNRFRAYRKYGAPFVSVSYGCAVRLVILLGFGIFVFPFFLISPGAGRFGAAWGAWILWGLLLIADLTAIYHLQDIRRRLRLLDSQPVPSPVKSPPERSRKRKGRK